MNSYQRDTMDFTSWNSFWSILFATLACLIFIGNLLTVVIFSRRKLRKRPHFLLISLAVADLLVGLLSIPIYVTLHMIIHTTEQLFVAFDCVDMLAGHASVFILAAIALERMHAIGWPLRHRTLSTRVYMLTVVTPWCFAVLVTSSRILLFFAVITRRHFVMVIIISLTTPLAVMTCCYCFIRKTLKSRLPNLHRNASEEKLSKTLLLVTGSFVVTWLPFEVLVAVINLCVSCQQIPLVSIYVIKLLHYSNSLINIIIYPLRIPEFKDALLHLLPSLECLRQRHRGKHRIHGGISVISMTTVIDSFSLLGFEAMERISYL